jgi:release factor glutamine methyltransferase
MKVLEAIKFLKESFLRSGIKDPLYDAQKIIAFYLEIPFLELNLHADRLLTDKEYALMVKAGKRRAEHEPLQYIFGKAYFMDLDLFVGKGVLIPRKETELLVEKVLADFPQFSTNHDAETISMLDIGTGSGNIAISIAKHRPDWHIQAVDISPQALKIGRENARRHNVKVSFRKSDLFKGIVGLYDVIIANPPYISEDDYGSLDQEIIAYEPESALVARENGLYYYRRILREAKKYLRTAGVIYFEIGFDQGDRLRKLASEYGYRIIDMIKDYQHFDRVVKLARVRNSDYTEAKEVLWKN